MSDNFENANVAAIMRHTGLDRDAALENFRAIDEGQRVFNAAKKIEATTVSISRTTLYRLLMGAGAALGMDAKTRGGPGAEWQINGGGGQL